MTTNNGKKGNQELEKVLAYQSEVAASIKTIADLEAAIEVQQAVINDANSFTTGLPDLHTRREDLLADMITGGASEEDLAALDEEIRVEKDRLDDFASRAAKTVPDAKQAIMGLTRKLEAAIVDFDALKDRKPYVLSGFLQSEAERLGAEYIQHATELISKYRLLLAYGYLLRTVGINRAVITSKTFSIPLFDGLAAHKGHDWPHMPGVMCEALKSQAYPDLGRGIAEEEKTKIATLGVEW